MLALTMITHPAKPSPLQMKYLHFHPPFCISCGSFKKLLCKKFLQYHETHGNGFHILMRCNMPPAPWEQCRPWPTPHAGVSTACDCLGSLPAEPHHGSLSILQPILCTARSVPWEAAPPHDYQTKYLCGLLGGKMNTFITIKLNLGPLF